eukprot:717696-Amphidinium_carterae.2
MRNTSLRLWRKASRFSGGQAIKACTVWQYSPSSWDSNPSMAAIVQNAESGVCKAGLLGTSKKLCSGSSRTAGKASLANWYSMMEARSYC